MTSIRVGIVSWNTAPLLDRCLAALPAALGGLDAEVVVVDNASSDGSAEVAARHTGVRVVRNAENLGYARAMNQALAGGSAEVLIALNPDAEPPPASLATLVERLLADPGVGLVAPRLVDDGGRLQHSAYRFPSLALAFVVCFLPDWLLRRGIGCRWWLEGHAPHDRPTDVEWVIGAVHVLRSAALGAQPYDERWFMYVEDLDLCWRLDRSGWRRRLEADVTVPHAGNAAGAQAWGAGRTDRWLRATLDWYGRARGRRAVRLWSLVNAAGLATRGLLSGRPGRRQRLRAARLHLRTVLAGPPPPQPGPPVGDPVWRHQIRLDHPPSADNRPRYGYGRPRHAGLDAILRGHADRFRSELAELAAYADDLARIPARSNEPGVPEWVNPWLLGLDTVSLYGYVRRWKPARYLEVGSGQSTLVVARARSDGATGTRITSIDPAPRTTVDAVCDEVVRQPLELVDTALFRTLEPGDMVFVDASHRVYMNSDMVAFYLDVLPQLPSGVLVGVHDILWPDDYLPEWADYWFSEQYLLGAYLLAGTPWIRPLLACNYAAAEPDLAAVLDPLWDRLAVADLDRRGFCFWFAIER